MASSNWWFALFNFVHLWEGLLFLLICIVPAVYTRMPFPTDDNLMRCEFRRVRILQCEVDGTCRILTTHDSSKFGVAWSCDGRSIMNSPYSSVVPYVQLFFLVLSSILHATATLAPSISFHRNTLLDYDMLTYIYSIKRNISTRV